MTTESTPQSLESEHTLLAGSEWWRTAVIYQIYPRSFADDDGNGIGDLAGITKRLPSLAELGVDAVWLSPFFRSPQKDAGYDVADYCDVDPLFGTLDDFDRLLAEAHDLGLKVIVDMVPNHTSDQHRWFQEALAAPEGSPERDRYMFRDGKGPNGDLPPNNWESVFGGPMWERTTKADGTPGQWFLHIFDKSQPDLNWENPWVREQFRDILRFWLDRGVDGFRVDVAHGMIKEAGLPDYTPPAEGASMGGAQAASDVTPLEPVIQDSPPDPPYWGQEGVHDIWREWHAVLAEYEGDRVLCAEAWVDPLEKVALWVRPDEMSQAFNFAYMFTDWKAPALKRVIIESIAAFGAVGAPATWVLSNHDVVRHASRLALTKDSPQGAGIGPKSLGKPDPVIGLRRARAATSLMLALPGSAYLYQGEELGLPEDMELPDEARQDPTWFRTNGEKYGRDGCRVPIPWESEEPAFGFNSTGASWLPQPAEWASYARDGQIGVPGSTLELYRAALRLRAENDLGGGELTWIKGYGRNVVAFRNGDVTVLANLGKVAVELPVGEVLLASEDVTGGALPRDTTVWMRVSA
ncbi:alpha-glucosidase [Microbacteriaceae bacterium SG_E_30_P1]|uniref:Alpha-glucosidase n=1 Tax=Antiquaquibacter oligotrophicus TaxID=2880260 RepID=A0ABT6KQC5_9MICO|nr:glycoside hydrolase family 13 protein [Antiquaquibacter oligotrophicus]MDH6181990.1 alpha-glucosidase [Antiquaquibacter oligotrophicus]UDF12341.1 glycoside hydrolase family 13 protein [Antiquaquibacter oligotrophicus]